MAKQPWISLLWLLLLTCLPEAQPALVARRNDPIEIAVRQINLSLLYTLVCDTSVSTDVQVKRFQCLLGKINPSDKVVILGCQHNVGGTMDAATFLTALCENTLSCVKLRTCMATERVKNAWPQPAPVELPDLDKHVKVGISGQLVTQHLATAGITIPVALPTPEATTTLRSEPTVAAESAPPSPLPPAGGGGDDEGSREDQPDPVPPAPPVVTTSSLSTSVLEGQVDSDVVVPPDDPLPPVDDGIPGNEEMSFYPCLCARKAKFRGRWKPRHNSRRTRAVTWKDYNFIFPLDVVRECLVAG